MAKQPRTVIIIGAGIGGLATAALLAKAGLQVEIHEARHQVGGRAGQIKTKGFTFDTGPSWYLMPEIFEHFFGLFGQDISQVLKLERLNPAYKVFSDDHKPITIYANEAKDTKTFEAIEKGAGAKLHDYLERAQETYKLATESFLFTSFDKPLRLAKPSLLPYAPKMVKAALQPIDKHVSKYFTNPLLKQIMEYPMVFLGTSPYEAPALFQLMSHMDFRQGVFYPQGGLYTVIEAIANIAKDQGVKVHLNSSVQKIMVKNGHATGVKLADGNIKKADLVISNSDLHFTETSLLPAEAQSYPAKYWQKKQASPSAILMYLGVKGSLPELDHHNLLFTKDWQQNFGAIFNDKTWPEPASLYISKPSQTDPGVAPAGYENLFVLVPIQADPTITDKQANHYADKYLEQIEQMTGITDLRQRIVYKKIYGPQYFANELHSWQASLLGMSHKLSQSALFRPHVHSKKVSNLYYVGANSMPGIGLPMCLIGAELVYKQLAGDDSSTSIDKVQPIEGGHETV